MSRTGIGVVGYMAPTGIGYLSRSLVRLLPASAWLIPGHRHDSASAPLPGDVEATRLSGSQRDQQRAAAKFVSELRAVVAVERAWPAQLFQAARSYGCRSVLLVMGEWFDPRVGMQADVLVAPTAFTADKLREWGFAKKTAYVPMPLDLESLGAPRRVSAASTVAFCDGWGGVDERKGAAAIGRLLEVDPSLLEVRSQRTRHWPAGATVRPHAETQRDLYAGIDACVQPSRWEGLGMQQLEAMALGIPVVTTNAPPMSEHCVGAHGTDAVRLLCPCTSVKDRVISYKPWPDARVDESALLRIVRDLRGSAVQDLSEQAAAYARQQHGDIQWQTLREVILG